jgi:transposase-like protein
MHQISDSDFSNIVQQSITYSEICKKLGLRTQGSNYSTVKRRIQRQNLSISHFDRHLHRTIGVTIPLSDILKENSTYGSSMLKPRLIKENMLENKCCKCGLTNTWQDEPISLQLDHINGIHTDNRIENLRILCPNCHSQTTTYAGKNLKRTYYCPSCNSTYAGYGKICIKCHNKQSIVYLNINRVIWPSLDELKIMIWNQPLTSVAKQLKCSSTAIKRHCYDYNIQFPPRGYWQRIYAGYSAEEALHSTKKIRIPMRKWSDAERQEIKTLINGGMSYREVGKKFNVSHVTILRQYKNGGRGENQTLS